MEKRYDFTQIEKQMQEFWEREQFYHFNKKSSGEIYSIDTPPPTVNGSLHIGHLFLYTQAEMIARLGRIRDYDNTETWNTLNPVATFFMSDDNGRWCDAYHTMRAV